MSIKAGPIKSEKNYKGGELAGKRISWNKSGQKSLEVNYKDGLVDGKHTSWYENCQISVEKNYKDGECISGDCDYFKKDL